MREFLFENGTTVFAEDYPSACVALSRTNSKLFTLREISTDRWLMEFDECVSVDFEAQSEHFALIMGPYLLHLDKRIKDYLPV